MAPIMTFPIESFSTRAESAQEQRRHIHIHTQCAITCCLLVLIYGMRLQLLVLLPLRSIIDMIKARAIIQFKQLSRDHRNVDAPAKLKQLPVNCFQFLGTCTSKRIQIEEHERARPHTARRIGSAGKNRND